jgi:glycosyltransferase involved in cell wall biosynthesis
LVTNDDRGGAAVLVARVARHLDPERYRVGLFVPRRGFLTELVGEGAEVFCEPAFSSNPARIGTGWTRHYQTLRSRAHVLSDWWQAGARLRRVVREEGFQVVSAFSPEPQVFCALAGLGLGVPVVVNPLQSFDERLNLEITLAAASLPSVRAVVAVSQAVGDEYRRLSQKLHVLYNGVDPEEFDAERVRPLLRARFGLSAETPVIGFVGRPTREKGVDLFLEAAARVHRERPEARFALIGVGVSAKYLGDHEYPFRKELPAVLEGLGLSGAALVTGPVDDVRPYIVDTDVIALPSRRDAAPLVGFEAMALGRPLVGFGVQGIPELARDGKEALLAPPEDVAGLSERMIALIDNPDERKRLGEQGRRRVKECFDLRQNVAKMGRLYESLSA